ncbi:hypothetical protein A2U01_0103732, partial [Trifolium medium]|nr:hypothetical protein [Trifolium medium]
MRVRQANDVQKEEMELRVIEWDFSKEV